MIYYRLLFSMLTRELSSLTLQLSFQMWTDQMQDSLNCKQKGDAAFRQKDLKLAIECYTQVDFFWYWTFGKSAAIFVF